MVKEVKSRYRISMINLCILLFVLCMDLTAFSQDSIENNCSNIRQYQHKDSIIKMNDLIRSILDSKDISRYECAEQFARQSILDAPIVGYDKGKALNLNFIADIFGRKGLYDSAAYYYEMSRNYRVEKKLDAFGIGLTNRNLGYIYYKDGQFDQAIEAHSQSIENFKEAEKSRYIGNAYNDLGNTYFALSTKTRKHNPSDSLSLGKAIICYQKALEQLSNDFDLESALKIYSNLGTAYIHDGNLDSAKFFLDKRYWVCDSILNTNLSKKNQVKYLKLKGNVCEKLGSYFDKIDSKDSSYHYFTKAIEIYQGINDNRNLVYAYSNLGDHYEKQNNDKNALENYLLAYKSYKNSKDSIQSGTIDILNSNLYKTYLRLGDTLTAVPYLFLYNQEHEKNVIREMEENAEYAQRIVESEASERVAVADLRTANTEKKIGYISLAGSILLLLALGITFYQRSRLHKSEQKQMSLEVEKKDLEIKQQEAQFAKKIDGIIEESSKKLLEERVKTQEIALRDLGRELHDNVGGLLSACKREAENITSSEANSGLEKTIGLIQKAIDETRGLSHNLKALNLKNGLVPALREFIRELNEIPDAPEFKLETFMMKGLELPAKWELNIYRIFQEASTNILKYAAAEKVDIQLIYSNDENLLNITIEDDGKGFDQLAEKSGIGLENMHDRAGEMGGKLTISSSKGNGTALFIEIPFEQQTS